MSKNEAHPSPDLLRLDFIEVLSLNEKDHRELYRRTFLQELKREVVVAAGGDWKHRRTLGSDCDPWLLYSLDVDESKAAPSGADGLVIIPYWREKERVPAIVAECLGAGDDAKPLFDGAELHDPISKDVRYRDFVVRINASESRTDIRAALSRWVSEVSKDVRSLETKVPNTWRSRLIALAVYRMRNRELALPMKAIRELFVSRVGWQEDYVRKSLVRSKAWINEQQTLAEGWIRDAFRQFDLTEKVARSVPRNA